MPFHHCCYGLCKSDNRYKDRHDMAHVFFIPFPKPKSQPEKCLRWTRACGREGFDVKSITRHTYICSKHFVGGRGPTVDFPDPVPVTSTPSKPRPPPRHRQADRVTSDTPCEKRSVEDDVLPTKCDIQTGMDIVGPMTALGDHAYCTVKSTADASTQTNLCFDDISTYTDDMLQNPKMLTKKLTMDNITKNNKSSKFYTGLSIAMLMLVFNWLKDKAARMTYWRGQSETKQDGQKSSRGPSRLLSLYEEFIITLMRLRRANDVEQLSDLFGVSNSHISRIFNTWINLMCKELCFLIKWPSTRQVKHNLPKCFKYFPNTKAVIDCTEFLLQKPSIPSSQRVTWSSYKHRNTLKCLVACCPKGSFTFVSKLWSGSISDRRIVQQSGFLDLLSEHDDIMADRGFLIRDLLAFKKATLNIPPFSHGRQLSSVAVTKTRRIASARIHVERAIGRLKEYKLLQGVIPLKMKGSLCQCVNVAASLCNLDNVLAK
ncbi:uncharacterized protein [Haliotis asinina]|uniref:uncharacterized protein isoform X2 n=1 Tax=Haliotis asinina TaxID=109174 RepID=UPI0035318FC9